MAALGAQTISFYRQTCYNQSIRIAKNIINGMLMPVFAELCFLTLNHEFPSWSSNSHDLSSVADRKECIGSSKYTEQFLFIILNIIIFIILLEAP